MMTLPGPSPNRRVSVGRVRRPWGLDGSVAVMVYADEPVGLRPGAYVYALGVRHTIAEMKRAGRGFAVRFEGVTSPGDAEKLRGAELEMEEADLPKTPPGVYYHYQLMGARVVTASGDELGDITEIIETGANDVYVVRKGGLGPEILVPAVSTVVMKVDTARSVVTVDLPAEMRGQVTDRLDAVRPV